jgi:predicted transcriptional regulator
MNIEVSQDVAAFLEQLAEDESTTKTEIVRRAISVLKAYKSQKAKGRSHIGFTSEADKLDAELVGILDS